MSGFPSDGVFASRLIDLPGYVPQDDCCKTNGKSKVGDTYKGDCGDLISWDESVGV
jgi:hypothetical protein